MSQVPPPPTDHSHAQTAVEHDAIDAKKEAHIDDNPLVDAFTETERAALKEFKLDFSTVCQRAFPDQDATQPFKLWGVEIDPQNLNIDSRVDVILMKFLRARNLSVRDAQEMMIATLRWRAQFNIDAAMKEYEDQPAIFRRLGIIDGVDKERRPVVYNLYGEANANIREVFGDVPRFIRWRVALMEESVLLLDFRTTDQTVQIHDYAGVSLTSRDTNAKNAAAEASNIFQNHYPEFLYKKLFINVPTFLSWIFWAFTPFLSAKTVQKMSVLAPNKQKIHQALLELMSNDQVPRRYGGNGSTF
ncbi:hypothetical protein AX16_001773 [Volvariella volvacea WC 439]|nr:hypothetical protein AX16_001773 [Volvariella volvacea WC 439]